MDFGVCSGTEMSDENRRKRQIECHIKCDPKVKGKGIIYPFYFILLAIFSSICQHLSSTKVNLAMSLLYRVALVP